MNKQNIILKCAQESLRLIAQLRSGETIPERAKINTTLEKFKMTAHQNYVTESKIKIAHYLLCSVIDESYYYATASYDMHYQSLLSQHHNDTKGGETFFVYLQQFLDYPEDYSDFLIVCFLLLAMGFKGKYALHENGVEILLNKRKQVFMAMKNMNIEPKTIENNLKIDRKFTKNKIIILKKTLAMLISAALLYSIFSFSLYTQVNTLQNNVKQLTNQHSTMGDKK